jgi:hypothetical protein
VLTACDTFNDNDRFEKLPKSEYKCFDDLVFDICPEEYNSPVSLKTTSLLKLNEPNISPKSISELTFSCTSTEFNLHDIQDKDQEIDLSGEKEILLRAHANLSLVKFFNSFRKTNIF